MVCLAASFSIFASLIARNWVSVLTVASALRLSALDCSDRWMAFS
jgi:hypothetical protein